MRFLKAVGEKLLAHKWLWLYGLVVFCGLVALAFTIGMRGVFSYYVWSPNLWAPYIFAEVDIVQSGIPVVFTFHLFTHFSPWSVSTGLFIATLVYWAAISFVVVTLIAALFNGLNLQRKRLVLWIDVVIVLVFLAYLGYADSHIIAIPLAWRFNMLVILLSMIALWGLTIALGHRPPLLGLTRNKRYTAGFALVAISSLGAIAYYDSDVIVFSARNLKPWLGAITGVTWLLIVVWLLSELRRKITLKLAGLIQYCCAFGIVAALAFIAGTQSIITFAGQTTALIRVLWLPHFNINDLISLPANQFATLYSYAGLFKGWNILSFVFTLMWWAIIARILVVLGRQLHAAVRKGEEPAPDVPENVDTQG
jgi:hypothetical protein